MGFKANIDIAISFSNFKICSVRQQGRIKFRVCLYYTLPSGQLRSPVEQIHYCHPYSILKKNNQHKNHFPYQKTQQPTSNQYPEKYKTMLNPFGFPIEQSQLDLNSDYYVSKPYKVMFEREHHSILETCCFRAYIDIERYEEIELYCRVQLMFCPNAVCEDAAVFKIIGKCQCRIRRLFDVSTYMPIVFDQFEGVVIEGVYQAALIDFRYERQPNQLNPALNPQNFHQYLKRTTSGFNRTQLKNFYRYYRQLLEKQLFAIQERHYDLIRVLRITSSHQQFRMLRVNPNSKIQSMIDNLVGYNSHRNTYSIAHKKYIQNQSFETHSSNTDTNPKSTRGISTRRQSTPNSAMVSQRFKMEISEEIVHDFLSIKAHLFKKWSEYVEFSTKYVSLISERYRATYNALVKERLSGNVFSHRVNVVDWRKCAYDDSGNVHLRQADVERKKVQKDEQLWKEAFLVQTIGFFAKDCKNIKIFQQIYPISSRHGSTRSQKTLQRRSNQKTPQQKRSLQKNKPNYHQSTVNNGILSPSKRRSLNSIQSLFEAGKKINLPNTAYYNDTKMRQHIQGMQIMGNHISQPEIDNQNQDHFIILVHGFQASRQDFIVIKNCLEIRFRCKVFISVCNEGRTDDDIQIQGKRLALQLQKYLNDSSPSLNYRLSFLGHSMGGILIRTALCYLQNINEHLYSYITLSTPHLGYVYEPETHIQAGLWLMNQIQKTTSIEQIRVRDKQNLRQSLLYRLSLSKTLDKFKNLAFVGSCQDKYVPYESALVQYNQTIIQGLNSYSGYIIEEMIEGLLGTVQCKQLSRLDVIFNIQQKQFCVYCSNFDAMIGRTAHIRYLSDRQFIKVFCIVFDKFFK